MSNSVSSPKNVVYVNGGQTYNVSALDDVININTSLGATEIVLPNIVNQGLDYYPKKFSINDTGGQAATNPITVSAVGNVVNSGTSFVLNRNNVSAEIVIVSKTEYLVNTDNGGSTGVFGSGTAGQLAYFSASTVLGSLTNTQVTALLNVFTGDSGSGGLKGLVPAPIAGDATKFLRGDGTWASAAAGSGTVNTVAKFGTTTTVTDSQITDDGTSVKIGASTSTSKLSVKHSSANILTLDRSNDQNVALEFINSLSEKVYIGQSVTGANRGFVVSPHVDMDVYKVFNILSSTGDLIQTLNTSAVADASLWANSVSLYTDGTNLKAKYKNNALAVSELVLGANLGNTNLTSNANARTYTLNGSTSSNYLQFLNGSSGGLLKLLGNNTIDLGSSTNAIDVNLYLNTGDKFNIYNGSTQRGIISHDYIYFINAAGTKYTYYSNNGIDTYGLGGRMNFYNTSGGLIMGLANGGSAVELNYCYPANTTQVYWYGDLIYFKPSVRIGNSGTPSARLDVIGAGSTSATVTAFFKNSSNSEILKIQDDGKIVYGSSTFAVPMDYYMSTGVADEIKYYRGSTQFMTINSASPQINITGTVAGNYAYMIGSGIFQGAGTSAGFYAHGATGVERASLYVTGGGSGDGVLRIRDAANNIRTQLYADLYNYIDGRISIGKGTYATATLDIEGEGNTSSTITALFKNSSSATVAQFRDDKNVTLGGSLELTAISTYTAASVTLGIEYTALCDATSNNITVNLPAASGVTGRIYNIKKIDATANTVTIDANASETIDGATTQVITAQYVSLTVQSNGTNWFII